MTTAADMLASAYEAARLVNIRQNQATLEMLGLQPRASTTTPAPTTTTTASTSKKKRKSTDQLESAPAPKRAQAPTRRSRRIQNLEEGVTMEGTPREPAGKAASDVNDDDNEAWEPMARKIKRLRELHKERRTAYKCPTATYEHTWMRVRTMSDNALLNRVKTIERALGQHCLVKMRMFAEVLILAGKDELAEAAQAAMDRLLAIVNENTGGNGSANGSGDGGGDASMKPATCKVMQSKVKRMVGVDNAQVKVVAAADSTEEPQKEQKGAAHTPVKEEGEEGEEEPQLRKIKDNEP